MKKSTRKILVIFTGILLLSWPTFCLADDYAILAKLVTAKDITGLEQALKKGADINVNQEKTGMTVLILAAKKPGYADMIRFLLEKGADLENNDFKGRTPLSHACESSVENTDLLLNKGAKVNVPATDGSTPLFWAIYGIRTQKVTNDIIEKLFVKGADINAQMTDGQVAGWTPLIAAANNKLPEITNLLIEKGAKVNHQADDGSTALMWASERGTVEVVKVLLEHGADIELKNKKGETAQVYSTRAGTGSKYVVKLLQDKKGK